jgi:hypothetical protein
MPSVGHKPTSLDLDIYRGDYWGIQLDEPTVGAFAPGDSFLAQIRDAADGTVLATFSFDLTAIAGGSITMFLTDTTSLDFLTGKWDLERTRSARRLTLFAGTVTLTKDISHT